MIGGDGGAMEALITTLTLSLRNSGVLCLYKLIDKLLFMLFFSVTAIWLIPSVG
jgi:hypothetical protein